MVGDISKFREPPKLFIKNENTYMLYIIMTENKETEVWKPFPDDEYDDLYQISNLGRCKRSDTNHILKSYKAGKYLMLSLSKPKVKLERFLVHRAVACAFIEDDDPKKDIINHIDGNKFNNIASNLEWTTLSQNAVHSREVLHQKDT